MDQGPWQGKPGQTDRFIGAALIAVGSLIAVLCGLCSLVFFTQVGSGGNHLGMLAVIAVFGGVPAAIGGLLIYAGVRLRRRGRG